jgi:cytochrome c oxidase subunit 2
MRIITFILLMLVPILGVWTWVIADDYGWWFPKNVSTYGGAIDNLFYLIMWMVGITFVATEVILAWFTFKYSKNEPTKGAFTHGNHKLEMIWTGIPAVLLLFIAFSQMGTWADIKFRGNFPSEEGEGAKQSEYSIEKPFATVVASQFDWRVIYPGADGVLGTVDDVENPFEMVVPVDTNIVFQLRSRDVLHSFFVPQFRLKQDAVPGHTIPVWFNSMETGVFDLICAELCGWGHYKMAGRVTVLPQDEFDAWMEEATAAWFSNGSEEVQ